jgi:transposase-like protein
VDKRRCYFCNSCDAQFYPTAGTIFEKTTTPLVDWMYIMYLFTTTRNGVSAKEIERTLGVTYKCAWRMGHKIRELIGVIGVEKLKGIVEADECFIGQKAKNMHRKKREVAVGYRERMANVFGAVERDGNVVAMLVSDTKSATLFPVIENIIEKGATIYTDKSTSYDSMPDKFSHDSVDHNRGQYVKDGVVHTNNIENFWSNLKRTIKGTHIHVSHKHIQKYINECAFRYNNRDSADTMFEMILSKLPEVKA